MERHTKTKPKKTTHKKKREVVVARRHNVDVTSERTRYFIRPPDVISSPVIAFIRRFQATAAFITTFSIYNMHNLFLMAVTTVLGYPIHRALRLTMIRIWAPVATQGTSVLVTLTPVGTDTGSNSFNDMPKTITDSSISIDQPAYISYKPKVDSPMGSWHSTITTDLNLFDMSGPNGSIIDMHFELLPNFLYAPLGYSSALSAATVGRLYARNVTNLSVVGVTAQ